MRQLLEVGGLAIDRRRQFDNIFVIIYKLYKYYDLFGGARRAPGANGRRKRPGHHRPAWQFGKFALLWTIGPRNLIMSKDVTSRQGEPPACRPPGLVDDPG
jgi:hypothetical protein